VAAAVVASALSSGCAPAAERPGAAAAQGSVAPASGDASAPATREERPSDLSCAPGTRDLGIHRGFVGGGAVRVRLCAVPGLPSTSPESAPGGAYHVAGAAGAAIVNATVSHGVLGLVQAARRRGLALAATSSFRTMEHQRALCAANRVCRHGDFTYVAAPGFSNHQLGIAIDFAGTAVEGRSACGRGRAVDPRSRTWRFLEHHARHFGLRQYAAESWHWDASDEAGHC